MFKTQLGATESSSTDLFLRPETAQGIFLNYLNVQKTARMKIPFGIAQIGKAFRNEIVARQFIFRMREFEQMEMQFFIKPGTQKDWYKFWKKTRLDWHLSLGIDKSFLGFMIMKSLHIMLMLPVILNLIFHLALKSLKVFIPELTLICQIMKNILISK